MSLPALQERAELRALRLPDLAAAAELLPATNAGLDPATLLLDLRKSWTRWPTLQIALVAPDGAGVLGLVAGRLDRADPTTGWSDDIILTRAARGGGWGARLIRAQLDAFEALGCVRVRGLSPQSLERQIAFFRKYGFRVIAEEAAHGLWGVRDGERVYITECVLADRPR